jgi:NADH:ubiquinone oxidoreductase subunit E
MATARLRSMAEPAVGEGRRHVFVVCNGEACQEAGAEDLLDDLRQTCGMAHCDLRVGASKCLGHCQLAPAIVEDGRVLGAVSRRRLRVELLRLGLE